MTQIVDFQLRRLEHQLAEAELSPDQRRGQGDWPRKASTRPTAPGR